MIIHILIGPYGSSGNSYYGGSGGYNYDNPRGPYGPPQTVDYPRYGYGSGYDVHDNINGLDWGTGGGYVDGVYGAGGYDGINIGGKVILFLKSMLTYNLNVDMILAHIEITFDTIGRSCIIRYCGYFSG